MTDADRAQWRTELAVFTWPLADQFSVPDGATIVVTGAYKGKLMAWLAERFPQAERIIGLEPQQWAYYIAAEMLELVPCEADWGKFHTSDGQGFLLGADNQTGPVLDLLPFGIMACTLFECPEFIQPLWAFGTDACTIIRNAEDARSEQKGSGTFVSYETFLERCGINDIDLWIMNIEGYEYVLLPWLLEHDSFVSAGSLHGIGISETDLIHSLAVQFHEHGQSDEPSRHELQLLMDEAYERVTDEYPAWVYWRERGWPEALNMIRHDKEGRFPA